MVSSVMYRARWTAYSSFCSSSTAPISRITARWERCRRHEDRGRAGLASGDVILTMLARRRQSEIPTSTPAALRLKIEPMDDCGRYDST
jgi:hypothetical protein